MKMAKHAATIAGIVVASLGLATLMIGSDGKAAVGDGKGSIQPNPPSCVCAPGTSTMIGTTLVHCQCGAATCVVAEHITAVAKSFSFQCAK